MNILVYDVAAENGGAASILEYYYSLHKEDKTNHYYYLLSTYHLENTDNITVINMEKIKRSWLRRWIFDRFGVRKYLKRYNIDQVLSLQNIGISRFKGYQTIYVHNALPFSAYKFSLRKNWKLWTYQNVIGHLIKKSIKKVDRVIVQTEWMKDAIVESVKCYAGKIEVSFPKVSIPEDRKFKGFSEKIRFLYPANSATFKNHKIIIQACRLLKEKGQFNYEVLITLNGDETKEIANLFEDAKKNMLPIFWVGQQKREELFALYETTALLFPSFIETVGLPIYEAMQIGSPLILADVRYAHNIADSYNQVDFFDYQDAKALMTLMERNILKWSKN